MIRTYCFSCDKCSYEFDLFVDSEQIVGYTTKCPQCKSKDTYRNYFRENITGKSEPKTLGMLADKNAAKKGIDFK